MIAKSLITAVSISEHFKSNFARLNPKFPVKSFSNDLHFVTARFDLPTHGNCARNQLEAFGKLYFRLSRKLYGNNLGRKRRQQPLCYAFVDADGSRAGSSDIFNSQMPHVHAVISITETQRKVFKDAFSVAAVTNGERLKHMCIETFDHKKGSVEKVISYSMKGYQQALYNNHHKHDLWALFPR